MTIFGYSLSRSLKDYGWAVALVCSISALVLATYAWNPVKTVENSVIKPVAQSAGLASSPADVRCLDGWTETTGKDPDGQIKLKVCTSPDKRYVITIRENQAPAGFDGNEARFLLPDEIAGFLR